MMGRRETERQLTASGVTDGGGVFFENRRPGGVEGGRLNEKIPNSDRCHRTGIQ